MVFLFDLDGVLVDTEHLYTIFWDQIGAEYLDDSQYAAKIKGQTLKLILNRDFPDKNVQNEIMQRIDVFESEMAYTPIDGAFEFLKYLKDNGFKSAIVTSSDNNKMKSLFAVHPELQDLVEKVFTSEDFTKSKPDPECFQIGIRYFGVNPEEAVVFEDSYHGLKAARASGAKVVALATTNPVESLQDKADIIISDFKDLSFLEEIEK